MSSSVKRIAVAIFCAFALPCASIIIGAEYSQSKAAPMDAATEQSRYYGTYAPDMQAGAAMESDQPSEGGSDQPRDKAGSRQQEEQAKKIQPFDMNAGMQEQEFIGGPPLQYAYNDQVNPSAASGTTPFVVNSPKNESNLKGTGRMQAYNVNIVGGTNPATGIAYDASTSLPIAMNFVDSGGGCALCSAVVGFAGFTQKPQRGTNPSKATSADAGYAAGNAKTVGTQHQGSPDTSSSGAKSNSTAKQSARGSSAGEDALFGLEFIGEDFAQFLINVANEDAGTVCSARQPFKTYANVVYMVQKMYHSTYLPLAILFILPGAILTQTKTLVSFGFLQTRDEDVASPFAGILRSVIAIFLIPATQLAVSYLIDIGNALEATTLKYESMPLILLWCKEQVVVLESSQQGGLIKNMPNIPMAAYRGKFAGMPIKGMVAEQVSGLDAALAELCNESFHMMTMAMTVMSAFQIAFICYLYLVGPLAAAFFAWPGLGRDLFRKCFSSWLDGVVILSLWKFWWNVVLVCWTIWLQNGNINPFDPFGPYYLAAWMSIIMFVPFNPFEFKPGEMVTSIMAKAEKVAAKVGQSGKGGGSGGGGKAGAAKGG